MKKENKKQELQKLRLKTKEEIEIAKQEHAKSLQDLQNKIVFSKKKEKKLKLIIEKDFQKFNHKQKLEKIKKQKVLKEKLDLINENRKLIIQKEKEIKKRIQLQKIDAKNKLLNASKEEREKVLKLNQELQKQKEEHKVKIKKLKGEIAKKRLDLNKEIQSKNEDLLKEQLETKVFLTKKKEEIFQQKRDLNKEIHDQKVDQKKEVNEKFLSSQQEQQTFKMQISKARSLLRKKILEIKIKNTRDQQKRQDLLEKLDLENKVISNSLKKQKEKFASELNDLSQTTIKNNNFAKTDTKITDNVQTLDPNMVLSSGENNETQSQQNAQMINNFVKKLEEKDFSEEERKFLRSDKNFITGLRPYKFNITKQERILNNFNKINNQYKIKRFNLSVQEEIKTFRKLKEKQELASIVDFVEYVSFVTNKDLNQEVIVEKINNLLTNIFTGKVLQFLNGYLFLEKRFGLKKLVFAENLRANDDDKVISFPQNDFYEFLNFFILDKLFKGTAIKINENIALICKEQKLSFVHDVGFLKGR